MQARIGALPRTRLNSERAASGKCDMAWRVGVDIGGTFTDVALVDESTGEIGVAKVPTTPRNLAEGVLAALGIAMDRYAVEASKVGLLAHATTVVTNAILEGRGA